MTLPLLLSVPHAGMTIPPEVTHLNLLTEDEIVADGDEGAAEIYSLESEVAAFVTTDVARAFVDMNRAEDDRRKDGVVKTHTCWDVPIYREPLSDTIVEGLLRRYYRPYHRKLSALASGRTIKLGIDCHTMAAIGPPIGPDPGKERSLICLSNADGTCSQEWLHSIAAALEDAFETRISINEPFKGGYIIRSHSSELPWIQLEISRTEVMTPRAKRNRLLQALQDWADSELSP
jgi:N-formylglutamate amidohydrolase